MPLLADQFIPAVQKIVSHENVIFLEYTEAAFVRRSIVWDGLIDYVPGQIVLLVLFFEVPYIFT